MPCRVVAPEAVAMEQSAAGHTAPGRGARKPPEAGNGAAKPSKPLKMHMLSAAATAALDAQTEHLVAAVQPTEATHRLREGVFAFMQQMIVECFHDVPVRPAAAAPAPRLSAVLKHAPPCAPAQAHLHLNSLAHSFAARKSRCLGVLPMLRPQL